MAIDVAVESKMLAEMVTQYRVEQWYTREAGLLDAQEFEAWLELLADDLRYFMPIRRTRNKRELDKEFTRPGEMAFFDDDKAGITGRVIKLRTGTAWAEDPPSRTRHLISNVRIVENRGDELEVESSFHLYRTRLKSEETSWIGMRKDVLRRFEESYLLAKRTILLDQTVLLSRNLSNFF